MAFPKNSELKEIRKILKKSEGIKIVDKESSKIEKIKFKICLEFLKYAEANELTQKELAEKILVDEAIVSKILRCRIESFSIDRLLRYFEVICPNYKIEIAS